MGCAHSDKFKCSRSLAQAAFAANKRLHWLDHNARYRQHSKYVGEHRKSNWNLILENQGAKRKHHPVQWEQCINVRIGLWFGFINRLNHLRSKCKCSLYVWFTKHWSAHPWIFVHFHNGEMSIYAARFCTNWFWNICIIERHRNQDSKLRENNCVQFQYYTKHSTEMQTKQTKQTNEIIYSLMRLMKYGSGIVILVILNQTVILQPL